MIGITAGFHCDETSNHCFTSIDIKSAFTMNGNETVSQVYAKDRKLYSLSTNGPVPIDDIITADGWNHTRYLLTANGSMPGPPIIIYQNQKITIIVKNHLLNEAVTLQTFNYTFKPTFGGSYWYHSHVGNQRDMGLYGAFIVLRKRDPVPFKFQHIVQIQEWNHLYDAMALVNANVKDKSPHSILINGRGEFEDITAPLETFYVDKGDRCLFRLIGVGSKDVLLYSIPGLKLNVTETDGFEVVPTVVDKIIIYPAERYDFELDLDYAKAGIYNITISILSTHNLIIRPSIGFGFLNVSNSNSLPVKNYSSNTNTRVLNCPFKTYPHETNVLCLPVDTLIARKTEDDQKFVVQSIPKSNETDLHFLNFGFPDGHSSINGRIFRWPTVSALTQPSEVDTDCTGCDEEKTCHCSHALILKSGSEVVMVLLNLGKGTFISHPIHMHGHTYEVLKMEFPVVTIDGKFTFTEDIQCSETRHNNESNCNSAHWRNSSWKDYRNIPGINLKDPVRKDSIVVPYGGYVIIRIEARNPGVWFMHCHIDQHMVEGMALMLNESFENTKIPNSLPTCHSFYNEKSVNTETSDSTTISLVVFILVVTPLAVLSTSLVGYTLVKGKQSTAVTPT
ncbi:uncharacterized protein LOC134717846 [Mytilus trossulus]|uniref:uncharacterized protein LOC134717846 n=1 Tax=Mytilus trossulus TaxID=6551 RepID=UPI003003B7D1